MERLKWNVIDRGFPLINIRAVDYRAVAVVDEKNLNKYSKMKALESLQNLGEQDITYFIIIIIESHNNSASIHASVREFNQN